MTDSNAVHHENNQKFYDRIATAYDMIADANEKVPRQAGVKALGLKEGESVLELGFGTGNELLELARLVGSKGKVSGVDISSGMLAVANRKVADSDVPASVNLEVCDARSLPFPDHQFDAVYTSFTLELFPADDIPVVLAEAKRVLKFGGRIAIVSMATVRPGDTPSGLEKVYVWMHRNFPHLVDCRPIDTEAVLKAAGFRIETATDLDIWTMPVRVVVGRSW